MKRWLASPLLSASLLGGWLLLAQSISLGHWLLGAALAVALPLLTAQLRPSGGPIRHPLVVARLVGVVGVDVVRSALAVAGGVARAPRRPPQSRFVVIALELHDPHALAALAVITAVVPGTVWCELAPDRSTLRLHVFDVGGDEHAFIAHYKDRYERPLKEIFG